MKRGLSMQSRRVVPHGNFLRGMLFAVPLVAAGVQSVRAKRADLGPIPTVTTSAP